jgi:hypothetical protein
MRPPTRTENRRHREFGHLPRPRAGNTLRSYAPDFRIRSALRDLAPIAAHTDGARPELRATVRKCANASAGVPILNTGRKAPQVGCRRSTYYLTAHTHKSTHPGNSCGAARSKPAPLRDLSRTPSCGRRSLRRKRRREIARAGQGPQEAGLVPATTFARVASTAGCLDRSFAAQLLLARR